MPAKKSEPKDENGRNASVALFEIQQALKVPKTQHNEFGGFNYRSCEDILAMVKPLAGERFCLLTLTDDVRQKGDRYYVVATATLKHVPTGTVEENVAWARETESRPKMDAAQCTGSASSYARKYALNGLLALDDTKDPDGMDNRQQGQPQQHRNDLPPDRLPNEMPDTGTGEVPDFRPPDEVVKGLTTLIDYATTVPGIEQLYWDNEAEINQLPDKEKSTVMGKFADKKAKLQEAPQ